jgi:4-hydroxybenzoate polyprenyltransferase
MLALLWLAGEQSDRGIAYLLGLGLAAGLFVYQQRLIRFRARAECFRAFLNNHYVGLAVFAGLVVDYALELS